MRTEFIWQPAGKYFKNIVDVGVWYSDKFKKNFYLPECYVFFQGCLLELIFLKKEHVYLALSCNPTGQDEWEEKLDGEQM